MKKILFLIAIISAVESKAQNYLITFAGTGDTTTITTVDVENLTTGSSLTLNGDDILRLTTTTGVPSVEDRQSSELKIYPNPMTDRSRVLFSAPEAGDAIISIFDIAGNTVTRVETYLEKYTEEYSVTGLKRGIYIVNVKGSSYQFSGKLISQGRSNETARIEKAGGGFTVKELVPGKGLKGVLSTIDMEYTDGERLKFTGISGNYSTVQIETPSEDKTVTFNFVDCTDSDGNSYPVVEINSGTKGPQVWMAANLRTTTYGTGAPIPLVTDNTAWHDLTTPGYCWYDNDEATYKESYGALYNWYVVGTGDLCPIGWHVPGEAEWTTLSDNLGGGSVAGGKLKETGVTHWANPNKGATNETGFTVLGSGHRTHGGQYYELYFFTHFWTATETTTINAVPFFIMHNYPNLFVGGNYKRYGFSVRCIKD